MRWYPLTLMALTLAASGLAAAQDVPEAEEALEAFDEIASPRQRTASNIDVSAVSRLTQQLSVRDPEPSCDDLTRDISDPITALRAVVETVQMPPWAPMRAASCLLEQPENARDDAMAWLAHPNKRGLAMLVVARLDHYPEPLALDLGRAALAGPWSADARRRLRSATNPRLRALLPAETSVE